MTLTKIYAFCLGLISVFIEQAGRKDEEKEFTRLIAQLQAEVCCNVLQLLKSI